MVTALAGLLIAGCGGGTGEPAASNAGTTEGQPSSAKPSEAESVVPAEAQAAATGDIPDNQAFLTYDNHGAGYSIRYPEGWARKGSGSDVTFQDRANVIHVVLSPGKSPTVAGVIAGLEEVKRRDPTVKPGSAHTVSINGSPVIKVTYTRLSAPEPVTGKRLPLTIDRYVYSSGTKVAIVDLGTPVGVDNVDAYRMISESFQWR